MADFYAYYPVPVNSGGGGSGTVTSVGTGNGLTGGPITTSGTISLIAPVVVANGGTNSIAALSNNRVMKSAGGSIVEAAAITAARALASDANGIPVASATTATELGYVSGVTSGIQAQIDAKEPTLTKGNLSDAGTDGITVTGGTGAVIGAGTSIAQHVADATHNGYLSSTDWSTFNGKQDALTPGSISTSTTGVTVGSGSASTVGPNVTVNVQTASGSQPGLLSAADWTTFNGKQASGNYITALTGDVTASGPGSVASTVAKIQTTTVSGTTGTTNVVFSNGPTLVAPLIGTPASGTLTNCTGLPLTGTTGTLGPSRGGTGQDFSASTGVVKVAAGTMSVATIVNADVSASAAIAGSKIVTATGATAGVVDGNSASWSGVKTFNDGIKLPTSGGTQSTLDYYEEWSGTVTVNGATGTMYITRVGRMVFARSVAITATAVNTNNISFVFSNTGSNIPTRFAPTTSQLYSGTISVTSNSLPVNGSYQATSSSLLLYANLNGGSSSFSASGNKGSYDVGYVWQIL